KEGFATAGDTDFVTRQEHGKKKYRQPGAKTAGKRKQTQAQPCPLCSCVSWFPLLGDRFSALASRGRMSKSQPVPPASPGARPSLCGELPDPYPAPCSSSRSATASSRLTAANIAPGVTSRCRRLPSLSIPQN